MKDLGDVRTIIYGEHSQVLERSATEGSPGLCRWHANFTGAAGRVHSAGIRLDDAAGNWRYTANNSQKAIQQLDAGGSASDVLTVTTADGTTHTVAITVNGAEDEPVIGGTSTGTVNVNGSQTAGGSLTISDADRSDNPINFLDQAAVRGENGYGSFGIIGGTWTYTLDSSNPAVKNLEAGKTLTDSHTFTASDGSTRVVTVTIQGSIATVGSSSPEPEGENIKPDHAQSPIETTPGPKTDNAPPAENESPAAQEIDPRGLRPLHLTAIDKIDSGNFGICEVCGEEIDIKRLEARPVTTMCIICKTEQEEEEKLKGQ